MLRKIEHTDNNEQIPVRIADAHFPAPFKEGLEYSSPARGTWNIVHTGMLIPESHQIFVCALGCLRGVVLTAAEMKAMDRYSSLIIREENVLDGNMEDFMIEGVADIIGKLHYRPKAILVFISCQHFFLAYDREMVFESLRERFPDIHFTDCYMIPTLRKSGMTPDQRMRIQMYSMLERDREQKPERINHIGSNLEISQDSELRTILRENGYDFRSLYDCHTFDDYLALSEASVNIYYEPIATLAAQNLEQRLGQKAIYVPFVYRPQDISAAYRELADHLHLTLPDLASYEAELEEKISRTAKVIGDTPVSVDYSLTFRYMNFTRMLLEHGLNVTEIYGDMILPEEKADFEWIREHFPEIRMYSCIRPQMRFMERERQVKMLAFGQKAAYFSGTDHFVNVVESGGLFGYQGLMQLMDLAQDAFLNKKDRKTIIQKKGYGCESCL